MESRSKFNHHEATEEENSAEVETEEDSEVEETETMGSEVETEDPEETTVTDPRDVSTAARRVTSRKTVQNVFFF